MKKILLMASCIVILLLYNGNSGFALLNFDIGAVYGAQPMDTNSTYVNSKGAGGFSFGMGIDLGHVSSSALLQLRFDVSMLFYPTSNSHSTAGKLSAQMLPIFLGLRFYFGGSNMPNWFVPYFEFGYEPIIYTQMVLGTSFAHVDTKIGLAGGAAGLGFEFFLYKGLFLSVSARFHVSAHFFWTVQPNFGYRF